MTIEARQLVPLISVADVERSIEFYGHLGFKVGNTFTPARATKPTWAWLQSGDAQLMVATASEPTVANRKTVPANQKTVLMYVYV